LNIWTQIRSQFSLDVIIIVKGGISSLLTTLHVFVACPAASDMGRLKPGQSPATMPLWEVLTHTIRFGAILP
jgi:hypothetical protein